MVLDLYNRKLLYHLDMNSRAGLGELSKKLRLSKNTVSYRIKNLKKEKIIRRFYATINTKKLGYSYFKVYFRLQNTDEETEKEIISYFRTSVPSLWITTWDGRYDLMVGMLAESIEEFYQILSTSVNKFRHNIQSHDIFIVIEAPHFKKDYLLNTQRKEPPKIEEFGGIHKVVEIDDTYRKILKIISTDARIRIVDIAEKAGSTVDIVRYRIRTLRKTGIIQGFRMQVDYPKIGYQLYKVLITTQDLDKDTERKIVSFCAAHPNFADIIIRGIGLWGIELQIDAKDSIEYHDIFRDFKNMFNPFIRNHETLLMIQEHKIDYFPF